MKMKKTLVSGILLTMIAVSVIAFYILYESSRYDIDKTPSEANSLDDWNIAESVLNGVPLKEDKSVYQGENAGEITKIYITVFPTRDDQGNTYNFSSFRRCAKDETFDPVLKANVQITGENEELMQGTDLNTVNATIKVRGSSSRKVKFQSYKIKLQDGAEPFYGQKVLNLNKHYSDVSKVSNKFCMDMMSQVDNMSSFRTNFMEVYIRDASLPKSKQSFQYYGLYTHVEQPNKSYLKIRGLDGNGSLYKANNFEFRLSSGLKNVNDPDYNEAEFEKVLKIREGNDHSKLIQMLTDINDMNRDFNKDFATYFNEDNYLTWMACNILLGNYDTISHNFILYNPVNSMTWYMLPWDYDGTFKFGKYVSSYALPESLSGIQRFTGVTLHRRYFKQEGNIDKLTSKINSLMKTNFTREKVDQLLNSYKPVLAKTLTIAPDLLNIEIHPDEVNDYLDQFYDQIRLHYEEYLKALEYPTPVFVSEPEVKPDGTLHFAWENSYDFQGNLLTYGITVARDHKMEDIVFTKDGIAETSYDYRQGLAAGTYYLAVTITDSEGNRQISLDDYRDVINKKHYFGIREFTVQ